MTNYYFKTKDGNKKISEWEAKAAMLRGSKTIHSVPFHTIISLPKKKFPNKIKDLTKSFNKPVSLY